MRVPSFFLEHDVIYSRVCGVNEVASQSRADPLRRVHEKTCRPCIHVLRHSPFVPRQLGIHCRRGAPNCALSCSLFPLRSRHRPRSTPHALYTAGRASRPHMPHRWPEAVRSIAYPSRAPRALRAGANDAGGRCTPRGIAEITPPRVVSLWPSHSRATCETRHDATHAGTRTHGSICAHTQNCTHARLGQRRRSAAPLHPAKGRAARPRAELRRARSRWRRARCPAAARRSPTCSATPSGGCWSAGGAPCTRSAPR